MQSFALHFAQYGSTWPNQEFYMLETEIASINHKSCYASGKEKKKLCFGECTTFQKFVEFHFLRVQKSITGDSYNDSVAIHS